LGLGTKKEGGTVDLKLFTPRIELGTFRVLGECHNQLAAHSVREVTVRS